MPWLKAWQPGRHRIKPTQNALDPRLCVLTFRQVCRFILNVR